MSLLRPRCSPIITAAATAICALSVFAASAQGRGMERNNNGDTDAIGNLLNSIESGKATSVLGGPDQTEDDPQCVPPASGATASEPWLESSEECNERRDYLEAGFDKFPAAFRETRAKAPAVFPRSCLSFIMGNYDGDGAKHSISFARCPNPEGQPIKGNYKPCITEQYVNIVYNTFGDVASCMGLPQKTLLAQLFNESNFEINRVGSHWDAGIGQLTQSAISSVNTDSSFGGFESFQNQILSSSSDACKRIAPYIRALKPASASEGRRCALLTAPENPMENLFYTGAYYLQNVANVKDYFDDYDVGSLLESAGLPAADRPKLEEMLAVLGYNAGPRTAGAMLKNYLDMRVWLMKRGESKRLTAADFDLSAKPKGPLRSSTMTFPEYLREHQRSGARGYLSIIAQHSKTLNEHFPEGQCANQSYLSL